MATVTSGQTAPISSGEFQISDAERHAEIERKHRLVSEFLDTNGYDALLLQRPSNFAWFTTGTDSSRGESTETTAALFVTRDARVVITSNADSAQLFERQLTGLGFQLKERPWHEPRKTLIEDICRGRNVAGDTGFSGISDAAAQLRELRTPLTQFECGRMHQLGRLVAHAVEATARSCEEGASEAEIAAEVAHRLIKHQVIPERIQVWADGGAERFPHAGFSSRSVDRFGTISVVGRRWGLCVGAARSFSFGEPPEDVRDAHFRAALVQSTGMYFSQSGWLLGDVWDRVQRIYEKFGCCNEWCKADQAEVMGYGAAEVPLIPRSECGLKEGMPVCWHPLVNSAFVGDTILVVEGGFELLTPMESWPKLIIEVKGTRIERPDILRRTV